MSRLNHNQRANIIFNDADILTARHWGALDGLHGVIEPRTNAEREAVKRLAALRTYGEIKATGTRGIYRAYMAQFCR